MLSSLSIKCSKSRHFFFLPMIVVRCWPHFFSQIPTNPAGLIEYRAHPYWMQKYCPSHERDGTPRCCSCERMEVR